MSKFRTIPYAALAGSLLVGGSAYAQSMYSIDQRQDYQQNRIEQGIRSGQITRGEAYRLEQGERAVDRAQARARADGVVTYQERNRIDNMVDRQGRQIYRQGHDRQQAWDRSQNWGRTDGRRDGWNDRYAWGGHNRGGWDRGHNDNYNGGDRGKHYGWDRGNHYGWDGNRPPGAERRDAWNDRRLDNGRRDGSLTRGEGNRLDRGQNRIDRYQAGARSDGRVTPYERGRIDQMQNNQRQRIYNARHNERTRPTTPGQQPSANWGHGSWRMQQAGMTQQAPRRQQPQQNWGGGGGRRMQQAGAPAPRQVSAPAAPRPTYTPRPSGGQRTRGR
ncbi:MAG: hypothetical protein GEV13_13235 [Rhodospirillales bacterium]|nr:hypothetical protein [Rhodospirillales bacterium]